VFGENISFTDPLLKIHFSDIKSENFLLNIIGKTFKKLKGRQKGRKIVSKCTHFCLTPNLTHLTQTIVISYLDYDNRIPDGSQAPVFFLSTANKIFMQLRKICFCNDFPLSHIKSCSFTNLFPTQAFYIFHLYPSHHGPTDFGWTCGGTFNPCPGWCYPLQGTSEHHCFHLLKPFTRRIPSLIYHPPSPCLPILLAIAFMPHFLRRLHWFYSSRFSNNPLDFHSTPYFVSMVFMCDSICCPPGYVISPLDFWGQRSYIFSSSISNFRNTA